MPDIAEVPEVPTQMSAALENKPLKLPQKQQTNIDMNNCQDMAQMMDQEEVIGFGEPDNRIDKLDIESSFAPS